MEMSPEPAVATSAWSTRAAETEPDPDFSFADPVTVSSSMAPDPW